MELEQFNDNTSYNLFRSDSMIIMVVYTHTQTREIPKNSCGRFLYTA